MDGIDAAVDTIVALNLDDLDQLATFYAYLDAASDLCDAYTDEDVEALEVGPAQAELKKAIIVINLLLTYMETNHAKRYLQ